MAHGWTPERRARQAAMIQSWQPWRQSTGARTAAGRARSSQNAYKGNHRAKLRELSRMVNEIIRANRDSLKAAGW